MKKLVLSIMIMMFEGNCVDMRNVSFEGDISSTRPRTPPVDRIDTARLRAPQPVSHVIPARRQRTPSLERENSIESRTPPLDHITSLRPRTPPIEYAMPYIPQHHDFSEEFHNESLLCFKLRRWVFQPVSVALQVTAGGLFVGGQCCIDKYPETAKILNGVGLGVSVASFVVNTMLLKIDNKLEEMDRYIIERREAQDRENRRMIPAIIQR